MNRRRIHLNLTEAANAYMGIGQYERNIAEALWRTGQYSIDAVSNRTKVVGLPFNVRRNLLPARYFFDVHKWHRFCPFSYNTLVGDFRSEVSVFFPNSMPAMRIRGKTIGVIHDLIPFQIPDVLINDCKAFTPESLKKYCEKHEYLVRHADKVVTDSEYSRKEIAKEFGLNEEDLSVVPCGVDGKRFVCFKGSEGVDTAAKKKYRLPERFILYFGSTTKYKNVDNLIRGYAKLAKAIRAGVHLVITHGTEELHKIAESNGIGENVLFLPFIPEDDKPSLYRLASAFAFLSRNEGFGLPPLEAMAAGVPVLVSNRTSLPEVVGDAALLVNPDDIDGIAWNLERLLEDNALREKLITQGYKRVRHFSWDSAAEKLSQIIDSL